MKKHGRKHLDLLVLLCIVSCTASSQAKSGVENYNMLSQDKTHVWMPVLHYQAKNGFYTELRYNYEEINTVSLYAGKTFSGGDAIPFNITPMTGLALGEFAGISLAVNADLEWKNFYLSSQTQYSIATRSGANDFFFSWSEAGYNISRNFFSGIAVQYTLQERAHQFEPGLMAGLNFKNISIPFYVFSPSREGRYFIVGLNYEFDLKKKK